MSHRGRRMQTSASREADCAVPCSWTQSSETRDGWINTMRKPACSQLLPLQCWNSNTVWAQSYEWEEDITTADFNIGKGHSAPQNCPSLFSFQRRERRDASIFPAMEGKITLLLYNTHCLQSLLPKKIQTSKTEHKIAISARDIKQHKLCHVAITHTHFLLSLEPLGMLQHLERSLQEGRIGSFATPKLRRIWSTQDDKWLQ